MALLDHFRAPLFPRYPWKSFHAFLAVVIAEGLNALLPPRYLATVQTNLGSEVEADVAEFEHPNVEESLSGASVTVLPWAPQAATLVLPAVFPDDLEVQVLDHLEDARLVAAIELVSPRNKDRPDSRRAFGAKCAAYLQRGIGVVVVDIVTTRQFNLHNELVGVMGWEEAARMDAELFLYAVAYRPVRRGQTDAIEVWTAPLVLGEGLPVLPLYLKGGPVVPLDLEASYTDARQRGRLPNGGEVAGTASGSD